MSRPNQIVTQFPALDHEPRGQGKYQSHYYNIFLILPGNEKLKVEVSFKNLGKVCEQHYFNFSAMPT